MSTEGPMPDLRSELEHALSPRFEIRREIGGGGMARVFLAREVELDRDVVIKVLPPEVNGLNLSRFRRETQTAARLHHPHIVPLHASGNAAGVLFYTMPYVDGETLRARISAARRMEPSEVIRIMRDVADALAYAHQQQLVHRDIKPENILLHSGHALVTDFGVAKALAAGGDHTVGGLAIGTPAYMAPEQAAGDPLTDHRADLYALGLIGYEMLTGRSPFSSRSNPQEIIAAHIAERPRDVAQLRPDTPLLLASLVMRCLEKKAEDRPQSAAVIREQLDAMRTPSGGIAAARWRGRRPRAMTAAMVMVPVAASLLYFTPGDGKPALDRNVVAVAPFRVNEGNTYLREGMLDLFAAKLTGEGGPRAADPRAVLSAWSREAGSDTADLSREASLRVAERLGAGQLLLGDVSGNAARLVISARLVDVGNGRLRASADVAGPADSLGHLIDGVTAQLLAIGAGEGARLGVLTSTPLPALRAYLSGQWLYRKGRYAAAGQEFRKALGLDSTFALAALSLMQASSWYGDMMEHSRAGEIAWRRRAQLSERDRAVLAVQLGPSYPKKTNLAAMVDAAVRYRDIAPDRAEAWFQLGDMLTHYGPLIGTPNAHAQAESALRRAVALDSSYSPALEHLVLLTARRGDTASAREFTRLYMASDSGGESAAGIRWRLAVATGDTKTADSIDKADKAAGATTQSIISWVAMEDGVRVPQSYAFIRAMGERQAAQGNSGVYLMLHDAALMSGRPAEARAAVAMFEKAVGPVPRELLRDALTADLSLAVADSAARTLRAEFAKPKPTEYGPLSGWTATQCLLPLYQTMAHGDTSLVHAGLANLRGLSRDTVLTGDYAAVCALMVDAARAVRARAPDARALARRADSAMKSGPDNPTTAFGNVVTARLLEAVGDKQGALAAMRRRSYFLGRKPAYGTMLREEGRLAAETGDVDGAIQAYRRYLAVREVAEPQLSGEIEAVRQEVARLERASAGR